MRQLTRPGSDEELEKLRKFAGYTVIKAALALGRNQHSVMSKARQLGVPLLSVAEARKAQQRRELAITGKHQGRWNSL